MNELKYESVKHWVDEHRMSQHPSEVHGLVTGWICAGSKLDAKDRHLALSTWLSFDLPDSASEMLETLYKSASEGLNDEEFGFRVLLPEDETSVNDRTFAVSYWCSGFLSGFGMTGRFQDGELSEDIAEVFADLNRIGSFSDEVPEDDENEADLIEITEYVRMSALLIFTECAGKSVH